VWSPDCAGMTFCPVHRHFLVVCERESYSVRTPSLADANMLDIGICVVSSSSQEANLLHAAVRELDSICAYV
jgi:hypothetical protein